MRVSQVGILAISASFVLPPAMSFAQTTDERIKQILADWKVRKDRFKSVKYLVAGVVEVKEMSVRPDREPKSLPPLPYSFPVNYDVLIDLEGGRFRIEKKEQVFSASDGRFIPRVTTSAYDRKHFQEFVPRVVNGLLPDNAELALSKGDLQQISIEAHLWPVFYAHGLVPTVNAPLRPDKWPTDHESEEFVYRSSSPLSNRTCMVLRSEPLASSPGLFDEFWIGQGNDSPVVRHVYYSGENPWYLIDVTYRKNENGSLPEKWELTHSIGGKVSKVYRLTVKSLEVNPAITDADFTLPIEPGMLVITAEYPPISNGLDPTRPASSQFRAEKNGSKTVLEAKGFTTSEGMQLPAEKEGWPRWMLWTVCGMLSFIVLVGLRWLVRRRSSTPLR